MIDEINDTIQIINAYIVNAKCDSIDEEVYFQNEIKKTLHENSPFKNEPVDYVKWIKTDNIAANDYNPNTVAPPEMELLKTSILHDGYTQPIVTFPSENTIEVVDGFHRNRVARESEEVNRRIMGYLPIVTIRNTQEDRNDRIASTIRHNRARGKHQVDSMSDIVVELKRRNWSYKRIGKELGMDDDEVLRLVQVGGLLEMFSDKEFNAAWEHTEEDGTDIEKLSGLFDNLSWADQIVNHKNVVGWDDRTENSSVLYGENNTRLGVIQKSRFKDEWFWYAYVQPMKEGRNDTKEEAMHSIEGIVNGKNISSI